MKVGEGLNVWNKVYVRDLARLYILLLERSLQEPQVAREEAQDDQGNTLPRLLRTRTPIGLQRMAGLCGSQPANRLRRSFVHLRINDAGEVQSISPEEEEGVFGHKLAGPGLVRDRTTRHILTILTLEESDAVDGVNVTDVSGEFGLKHGRHDLAKGGPGADGDCRPYMRLKVDTTCFADEGTMLQVSRGDILIKLMSLFQTWANLDIGLT